MIWQIKARKRMVRLSESSLIELHRGKIVSQRHSSHRNSQLVRHHLGHIAEKVVHPGRNIGKDVTRYWPSGIGKLVLVVHL